MNRNLGAEPFAHKVSGAMTALAAAAVGYAAKGRAIFPLRPRSKEPLHAGGFHTATDNVEQVRGWWLDHPHANIGLHPARSGLVVCDVDTAEAASFAKGLGLYSEPTLVVATGKGVHLYFTHPGFPVPNVWLGGVLLVRGDNGYVVVPPSIHPDTNEPYRVELRGDPIPLPPSAVRAIREAVQGNQRTGRPAKDIPSLVVIPDGQRHEVMKSAVGRLVALTGGRMEREELWGWLSAFNRDRCRPPIADEQLHGMLTWALDREHAKPRVRYGSKVVW